MEGEDEGHLCSQTIIIEFTQVSTLPPALPWAPFFFLADDDDIGYMARYAELMLICHDDYRQKIDDDDDGSMTMMTSSLLLSLSFSRENFPFFVRAGKPFSSRNKHEKLTVESLKIETLIENTCCCSSIENKSEPAKIQFHPTILHSSYELSF